MGNLEHPARDDGLPLIEEIERSLRELGIDAAWARLPGSRAGDMGTDGHLRVRWDGGEHTFPVAVKPNARPALLDLAGPPPRGTILMTEHVNGNLADRLERSGWQGYADASGNVSLRAPGLLIRVTGQPGRATPPPPSLPFNPRGLPVTFAVLTSAVRGETWTQRELARLTGSALATVNRVIQALVKSDHLTPDRQLIRPEVLRDQWTAAYLSIQPEAWPDETYSSSLWASPGDVLDADLPAGALIGSELAASRHGAPIRPTTALIHCPPTSRQKLIAAGRLRRDPQGFITVRPAFWAPELVHGARTAPSFLVRADLLLEDDPRLTEIARDRKLTWNDWI